jgi:putative intracellular protease/amidase
MDLISRFDLTQPTKFTDPINTTLNNSPIFGTGGVKGIVIQYPGCIMDEVAPAISKLQRKVQLQIVELAEVVSGLEADFLIIPGGSCDDAIVHTGLHSLIQKVNSKAGLLAGICNGALVLASAGVLKGRQCTHTVHPKYAPLPQFKELLAAAEKLFAGSNYVDEDVVISANVVTAKPRAAEEFAKTVLLQLRLEDRIGSKT